MLTLLRLRGNYTLLTVLITLVSSMTSAQERTEQGLVIEEVVVTVSKREESLQEVLGSVSAISNDTLARENIQDFASLVELIPGMVAQDEEQVAIRGISRTRDGPSPVAFHVNDVFLAERGEPYYDLQAIEILRGPSGTLFGRNATAGAINAKWKRPESYWAIGATTRYSSLEEQQLQAYLNVPLFGEDNRGLLARIALMSRSKDGTLDNLLASDEADPGNTSDWFGRIFLTSEPRENLDLSLRAIRYEFTPEGAFSVRSPTLGTRRSGELERLGAEPLPDDITKVRSKVDQNFGDSYRKFNRFDGEMVLALKDIPWLGDADMVLVGGEQHGDAMLSFDLDGTEASILEGMAGAKEDIRRTAEFRLVSQNDSGFDWLFGLFWYRQTSTNQVDLVARGFQSLSDLGFGPSFPGEPQFILEVDVDIREQRKLDKSEAIFINTDFNLARLLNGPDIEITAGIRRNFDEFRQITGSQVVYGELPEFGRDLGEVQNQSDIRQFAHFQQTTGELGLRWFYSDAGMIYAEFARGYKPGLAQLITGLNGQSRQNPVDPEQLNAWEFGWKTSFFNQLLRMNFAAFTYDYRDLQVSQLAPGGFITENAAEATINGAEVELEWMPSAAAYIKLAAAWTDARYDNYCGNDAARGDDVETAPSCTDENPLDFSGERMTAAPEYSAALLVSYTFELEHLGSLTPSLRSSWSDVLDRRGVGNPIDRVEAHSTTDLRLIWRSREQHWKIELFAENVEDNNDIFFQSFAPAVIGGSPNTAALASNIPPRVFGISVEANY